MAGAAAGSGRRQPPSKRAARVLHALRGLYDGRSRRAAQFRYALLAFDIATIAFFVIASLVETTGWGVLLADYVIAAILTADYAARLAIARNRFRFAAHPVSVADLVVIVTLLVPALLENLAFLRVLRALRLVRSYRVVRDLRARYRFFARNQDVIDAVLNLVVFIFLVTAVVYVLQVDDNPEITSYIDALYFTVATLTTTGFGDITLTGSTGRVLAVVIMVLGVALFLRLVQTVFRPSKVVYECPDCGLSRHDGDAIHCKHCGRLLHIETEGL